MALAAAQHPASAVAMNGDGQAGGLHPFFTALRTQSRDSPPPSQRDIDTRNEDQEEIPNQRVEEEDLRATKSRKSRKRSPEKNGLQSTLSFEPGGAVGQAAQLRLAKAKEAEHDGDASRVPARSNEFASVPEIVPQNQPAVIDMPAPAPSQDRALHPEEEEPHQRSKKRQRTPSENQPATPLHNGRLHALGWEEQLLQAAFGDSSPANIDEAGLAPEKSSATESVRETISANHTAANPVVGAATVNPKSRTPPKKVIKLRTDGRLISPRANEDGTKKGRGKRKSGQMAERLSKLLTMRYSRDAPAQAAFGKQIDEILCGATRYKLPEQKPLPASAVSMSEEPSKPTHPFFMGKVSRSRPEPPTSSAHEEPDTDTSRNARSKSPKKLAVSSKSSWAGFGASFSKSPKAPGSTPAIWPPNGMVHCTGSVQPLPLVPPSDPSISQRKLKGSETRLGTREDVLNLFQLSLSQVLSSQETVLSSHAQHFNHPSRKLLTGTQLRAAVDHHLSHGNPSTMHPAMSKLYEEIMTSMSAFDKFECQIQQWDHKYSPKLVANVLTYDANLLLLREWLFGLTVNTVNIGASSSGAKEALSRRAKARAKKKRKVSEGLDDFIVSSEDELSHGDETTDPESETDGPTANLPRLSQRNLRRTKAVLLCGPHGCGKTAAVYAVAQELGFEVFEINSGSRRSGRDILDRVGDMTHNHLVRQLPDDTDGHPLDRQSPAPDATAEIESGRQSTMQSFFQSKPATKSTTSKAKAAKKEPKVPELPKKAARRQKQSLILLEEVDNLFEDDKQFWTTVLSLLLSSRRPVVMTCTDENLLPLEEMIDVTHLRLLRAPETLAVDYLLLLAANEGHLITRSAMEHLFQLHNSDLRASIVQLNFLCQMALGDTKGGLEWMLIRSNVAESTNEHGEPLRVISADTFRSDMTALTPNMGENGPNSRSRIDHEVYLLDDIHASWKLEAEDWVDAGLERNNLKHGGLESLRRFDAAADGLSVADFLPGSGLLDSDSHLDPTYPPLASKDRASYPEGYPLLDTPVRDDPSGISQQLVHALRIQARSLRFPAGAPALTPDLASQILANRRPALHNLQHAHTDELVDALSPLCMPNPTYLGTTSPSRLPAALSTILATDIAPYVRSIAVSDLRLEQSRLKLSNLISEGGTGGKKSRTTRAARAALEGGRKESTRRERWFRKELNYKGVLRTAGVGWQEASAEDMRAMERAGNAEEKERPSLESGLDADQMTDEDAKGEA